MDNTWLSIIPATITIAVAIWSKKVLPSLLLGLLVTSPVAGMTNMASNAVDADQAKYLKYANPYNFTALVLSAILFLIFGVLEATA